MTSAFLKAKNNRVISLSHADCLAFLKRVETNSVDLVLTDPPYEISRKTGFESCINGVERLGISMDFGEWDNKPAPMKEVISELYRVLKQGGTAIIFYDLWKISHLADLLKDNKFKQLRFLEWVKTNPVPINSSINYLTNSREIALLAVKGGKPTFHSKYDNGIYSYPICHEKGRFHPTQKPVRLIEELIEKHSNEGDLVLDCFSGSGSTAAACINTGREFIGCELDEIYYTKSRLRLSTQIETLQSIEMEAHHGL